MMPGEREFITLIQEDWVAIWQVICVLVLCDKFRLFQSCIFLTNPQGFFQLKNSQATQSTFRNWKHYGEINSEQQILHYLHCVFHHHKEIHRQAAELGITPAMQKNEGWENVNKHHRRFVYRHSPHGGQPE